MKFDPKKIETYPSGMAVMMEVDPKGAQWFIDNKDNFRSLNLSREAMYSHAMKAGRWTPNEADNVVVWRRAGGYSTVNGNTRMHAVVSSGTTQKLMIMITDTKPNDANYDVGKARNAYEYLLYTCNVTDRRVVSIVSELLKQQGHQKLMVSREMLYSGYQQYKPAVNFVLEAIPTKKAGITIPILTAIARGYYFNERGGKDRLERLQEFADQICGEPATSSKDAASSRLLHLMSFTDTNSNRQLFYTRCERALHLFLEGKVPGARGITPAPFPGSLLPIPVYDGPGAEDGVERVVEKIVITPKNSRGETAITHRVRVILMSHPEANFALATLAKQYNKDYGEELSKENFGRCCNVLSKEAGFYVTLPPVRSGPRLRHIKYVPAD